MAACSRSSFQFPLMTCRWGSDVCGAVQEALRSSALAQVGFQRDLKPPVHCHSGTKPTGHHGQLVVCPVQSWPPLVEEMLGKQNTDEL